MDKIQYTRYDTMKERRNGRMLAAICLDNCNGMSFHRRRQSRDRAVIEDLLLTASSARLRIPPYSAELFEACPEAVIIEEAYLERSLEGDICFVELDPLKPVEKRLEGLIVYRWNRSYPSDHRLDIALSDFILTKSYDFSGSSHERITKEVYVRC